MMAGKGDSHARLMRALVELAGPGSEIISSSSRSWASATFTGAQHRVELRLEGPDAYNRAQRLADSLPEAEFVISGHIVADLSVESREQGRSDAGVLDARLTLAVLTVEDW